MKFVIIFGLFSAVEHRLHITAEGYRPMVND